MKQTDTQDVHTQTNWHKPTYFETDDVRAAPKALETVDDNPETIQQVVISQGVSPYRLPRPPEGAQRGAAHLHLERVSEF